MLNIHNLSISFQGEYLFEEITFKLGNGDRIGLIGKNGAGKSTMLRILSKEQEADSGQIAADKDLKIGFLKQDIDFDSIRPGMLAADVIVNPPQTYFLDEAGKRGATTLQGLGMVVNQAVIGIKYWTGADVDPKDLNDELLRVLGLS